MTPAELRTLILGLAADHPARVAFEQARDVDCAAALAVPVNRGPVPIAELSAYCVGTGIVGACEAAAYDDATPLQVKGLCFTVLSLVRDDYRLTTADVDDSAFGGACDGMIASGLMTTEQKTAILALGASRTPLAVVSPFDVGNARNLGGN